MSDLFPRLSAGSVTEVTLLQLAHDGIVYRLRGGGLFYSLHDLCRLEEFSETGRWAILWTNSGGNYLAVEMALLHAGLLPAFLANPGGHGCRVRVKW